MAGRDDNDGRLVEDMVTIEALLGDNVVQMVTDSQILELLKTYSSDRDRVRKVVDEVRRIYLNVDLSFFQDEDGDALLAVDSPYLRSSGERTPNVPSGSVSSCKDSTAPALSGGVIPLSSTYSHNCNPENTREEPILRPAKLNIAAAVRSTPVGFEPSRIMNANIPCAQSDGTTAGSFVNHRKADFCKRTDSSGTSTEEDSEPGVSCINTDEDSEPEVLSIHTGDRKRKKLCGNKSPEKKTRIELVDLVNSSSNCALNYEDYLDVLEAMFPDADPLFLRQKFKNIENEQELNFVAASLLESNYYPRISTGAVKSSLGERPSTSNNSSVIIRPSAFQVPHTNEPQPSTSSNVCISNTSTVISEVNDRRKPEGRQSVSSLDVASAIRALEESISVPQPGGTDMPSSSDTSNDAYPLLTAVREFVASVSILEKPPSCTAHGVPSQKTLDNVPSHPAQTISDPKTCGLVNIPSSPAFSHETSKLLPTSEPLAFPSLSHDKNTVSPSPLDLTENSNRVGHSWDTPGPSGTNNGNKKEEPWAEKYSTLLCLFPQSDPKYLERKAKLLHDKDIDFNLFVETTLENMVNSIPNEDRRDIQESPVNLSEPVNIPVSSAPRMPVASDTNPPETRTTNTPGSRNANVPPPGSASNRVPVSMKAPVSGSSSANTSRSGAASASSLSPRPSATNVSTPGNSNAPTPNATNVAASGTTNVPRQSGINAARAGPSGLSVPGPSGLSVPGPSGLSVPGPSGLSVPGPSGLSVPGPSGLSVPGPSSINSGDKVNPWSDKLAFVLSILPDADPTFLEEKAKLLYDKEEDLKTFVANALENKDYPTLKDYQRRQEIIALQNKYLNNFNIENFLDIVPEPFKYFSQTNRKPSPDSQNRGLLVLKRKYRLIRSNDIMAVYRKHQYNLTNTCHELNKFKGVPLKSRRPDFQIAEKLPDSNINLQFLQEVAFIENEDKIKKYLEDKLEEEKKALKEAREKGELLECNCCFDDEVLSRNIVTCPEGHVFCKSCVRKGVETKIGDGETKFSCLTDCQAEFTLQSLQGVLKPTVFSKLAQRKQLEEIKAAGIEDLLQCPFCDFCNIPGTGDKIFRCLNPDCMKDSCIMCKEESHIPLRCDEVEKASEVKMRTYIEDKMTEALVRTCWKCQRKFVKIDGCNKMTCQCGALMCYICRQPVKDYSHFNGQGGDAYDKCPLFSDNYTLHVDAVEKVAAEAKAELAQKHPGVTLKHDPTSVPIPGEAGGRHPGPYQRQMELPAPAPPFDIVIPPREPNNGALAFPQPLARPPRPVPVPAHVALVRYNRYAGVVNEQGPGFLPPPLPPLPPPRIRPPPLRQNHRPIQLGAPWRQRNHADAVHPGFLPPPLPPPPPPPLHQNRRRIRLGGPWRQTLENHADEVREIAADIERLAAELERGRVQLANNREHARP